MIKLFYNPSALRVIKKFSTAEQEAFQRVVAEIRATPQEGKFLKGSLQGLRKWKFRVGAVPYRVVYKLESDTVTIIATGKRKDFYELL